MSRGEILVIEDDAEISGLLAAYLKREGFQVELAGTGAQGVAAVRRSEPDLVLLDIMLPDQDGLELCSRLRGQIMAPILVVSAKGEDVDKVLGLGLGADDYITKPFSPSEVVARVKAHLRRYQRLMQRGEAAAEGSVIFGDLHISVAGREVRYRDQMLMMTPREFDLLRFMALNPNRVFTLQQLYEQVWGDPAGTDCRTVQVYIYRLRNKLQECGAGADCTIETVWGVGYKLTAAKVAAN